jgi:hypothetical protein
MMVVSAAEVVAIAAAHYKISVYVKISENGEIGMLLILH